MAITGVAAEPGARLSPAAIPLAVGATVYLVLLLKGDALLNDPDTYSHVALGRWIIEHDGVPTADPFSSTFAGTHWVAFEWLSDILYAAAQTLGGWQAVVMLAAIAVAVAFAALSRFLLREIEAIPALVLICAAFMLLAPHVLARPHVLALPLMVVWVAGLVRASDEGRVPPLALLPLMTVWTNLHGSFLIGLALVGPIAFEAMWYAAPAARVRTALRWAGFGALAVVAALINPYGIEIFAVLGRTFALGEALGIITEWRPQDFGRIGPFEVMLCAGLGYALFSGMELRWTRILLLVGLLHLALSQTRHADLLALLAPLFLARPLAEHLGGRLTAGLPPATRVDAFAGAVGAALLIAASAFSLGQPLQPADRITPAAAVAATDLAHVGPVLNAYDFGAYLDFVGIPPFIDGRTEIYGGDFALRHANALSLADLPGLLTLLDEFKIKATLLPPGTPANAFLDRLPGWKRAYADGIAVVYLRRDAG